MMRNFVALITFALLGLESVAQDTNAFPTNGSVGIGTLTPNSYFHGGNNKVLEISNLNTSVNSQSHVILSTGSTLDNSSVGTLSWVSKNSNAFPAIAYIGCLLDGDAVSNAAGKLVFATSTGNTIYSRMAINKDGNVGIGTLFPDSKLSVNGKIRAHEIKVETANWPDYVFAKEYQLLSLAEVEKHIKEKGHLPGVPSAVEVKANGIDLGEMNAKLLQKIEELTLHLIQNKKETDLFKNTIEELKKENQVFKTTIQEIILKLK